MKAALLGLSHPHSGLLLTTLLNLPEITEICLWDPEASALVHPTLPTGRKIIRRTQDLDEVLADPKLGFTVLCVRTDRAAAIALRILAAGKHLLAEKPVGLTSAEIAALAAAADRARVVASVLYVRRQHPCVIAAQALVASGELGRLLSFELRFLTTQVRFRDPGSWLFRREQAGGGILLWLGCHCLDVLRLVTGEELTEVSALFAIRSGEAITVEDTAALALRLSGGAIGTFHAGYTLAFSGAGYVNATGYDSYFGLNFERGRIVWPDLNASLQIERTPQAGESPKRTQTFDFPPSTSYGGAGGEAFIRQFIAATQAKAPPPTRLVDALTVAHLVEAAQRASESGRRQSLPLPS